MAANQIQFLTIEAVKNRITVPNYVKISENRCGDIVTCDFQYGGRHRLGFSQIRNLSGRSAARGQDASSC